MAPKCCEFVALGLQLQRISIESETVEDKVNVNNRIRPINLFSFSPYVSLRLTFSIKRKYDLHKF